MGYPNLRGMCDNDPEGDRVISQGEKVTLYTYLGMFAIIGLGTIIGYISIFWV